MNALSMLLLFAAGSTWTALSVQASGVRPCRPADLVPLVLIVLWIAAEWREAWEKWREQREEGDRAQEWGR